MLTHLIETQGHVGGLQPMRHKNSKRKLGQEYQALEHLNVEWHSPVVGAQVLAKA